MIDTQQIDIQQVEKLRKLASSVRRRDLQTVYNAKLGHAGGEMSATDILVTLYFAVLRVDPERPDDPDRDRFILSKGHSAVALYTTLAHRGFIPMEELDTFAQPLSKLNGHPDRNKVPGVETNTGPLGHGLPVAVGAALAAKLQDAAWRVSCSRVASSWPWISLSESTAGESSRCRRTPLGRDQRACDRRVRDHRSECACCSSAGLIAPS